MTAPSGRMCSTTGLHETHIQESILHGDVSDANIMWRRRPHDDSSCFILNDFDSPVAQLELEDGCNARMPITGRCVGTLAFMAVDVLDETAETSGFAHRLRHDCESLFWVAVWCTMKVDHDD
ncbi:hypothetical protein BD414DRAFT_496659 [Trametes punicea]|nr:hypothetical protein BD414DRAFT_496659 [Trametes punicea]